MSDENINFCEQEEARIVNQAQFDVLYMLYRQQGLTQRELSSELDVSLGFINKNIKSLRDLNFIDCENHITQNGFEELDKYKVDNAIILAAGMSTRFVPVSYEFPKGLTIVKGEVLIERQIKQLLDSGIKEIVVVVGHMLEKFFYLKEKYNVKLVVNNDYKVKNTHSSVFAARDFLKRTYICCSDNYYPENLFKSHEYHSMYCAQFLEGESRTERGLITDKNGLIIATEKPCKDAWTMQGHAYLDSSFSKQFKKILEDYYNKPGTENLYWEGIYAENLEKLPMYMVKCKATDILEFDSVENLREFDPDYIANNDLQVVKNICSTLNCLPNQISDISPIGKGMTNKSFSFKVKDIRYVYREPGKNTVGYINRGREKFALTAARKLGLDKSYLYEDEKKGWKISYYIDATEEFDFSNRKHFEKLCRHLNSLHNAKIKSGSEFDYFAEADKLIERIRLLDFVAAEELELLREKISTVNDRVTSDNWPVVLCHNDIYEPNLLISEDDLYLIDWEYAGDADIGYDICKLFAVTDAPLDKVDDLLGVYFERKPDISEKRHIIGCAAVNYYYWYVWSIYQNRSGNNCNEWQMLWYNKMNKYFDETIRLMGEE